MDNPKWCQHELFRERSRLQEMIDREGLAYLAGGSVLLEKFVFVTAFIARRLKEGDALTLEMKEPLAGQAIPRPHEAAAPPLVQDL